MSEEIKLISALQSMARLGYATSRKKIFVAGIAQSARFKLMFQGFSSWPVDSEAEEHWFKGNFEFVINQQRLKKTVTDFDFNVDNVNECYIQDTFTFGRISIRFLTLTGLFALRYLQCKKKNVPVPVEELLVFVPNTSLVEVHKCMSSLGAHIVYEEFLNDIEVFNDLDDDDDDAPEVSDDSGDLEDDDDEVINP